MSQNKFVHLLGMVKFFIIVAIVATVSKSARGQIKPRILLVFDTSGSMVWSVGPGGTEDRSLGDGSWDPWPGGRFCCPGTGNSRIFHAKEAVRQMVFAAGDIDFALMKFVQEYETGPGGTPNDYDTTRDDKLYWGNQEAGVLDQIPYQAYYTCEWPPKSGNTVEFAPYGEDDDIKWLCAEFPELGEDSRGQVLMWLDHHQYSRDNLGEVDNAPVFAWSRAGDGKEQELRAIGGTPIGASLDAARDYLMNVYDTDFTDDPDAAACRPYSVILLTDGDETCGGDTAASATALHTLTDATWGEKEVALWVIGFAYQGDQNALDTMAENGGTDHARNATNQTELSNVLYDIVEDSLLIEVCNQADDDCDGETDEEFRPDRTYCNTDNDTGSCTFPHDEQDEETEDILCVRPSECACDGIDNNCDGVTDEPPDGENAWEVVENACGGCDASVPGQEYCTDADTGRCSQGDLVCVPGEGYACVGNVDPSEEVCNGLDDDCDGETDELVGDACGACGDGHWYCVEGILQCCAEGTTADNCVALTEPEVEVCNGADDDCDGETDEGLSRACGGCDASVTGQEYCEDPNEGVCTEGVEICTDSEWGECVGSQGPETESCNGLDDDCDGLTDEDIVGEVCGTCGDGRWTCILGAEQCCAGVDIDGECIPIQTPSVETCNGIDDDCNGETDENVPPRECIEEGYEDYAGIGICNMGYEVCVNGVWGNENPDTAAWEEGYCRGQQLPVTETCNLADDDCDGSTDEDIVGESGCGPCGDGEEQCVDGVLQCTDARTPEVEVCNGADDDCDGSTDENLSRTCMDDAYSDLNGIGICHSGIEMCKDGEWGYGETMETWVIDVCGNQQLPQDEQCDCLDNDCDGETDEELGPPVGTECNACGVWECRDCEIVCTGFGEPEICDGLDNNCNGVTDEGLQGTCGGCVEDETTADIEAELLEDCLAAQLENDDIGPGEGECQVGAWFCDHEDDDKRTDCQGYIPPQQERCDDKDNDCDGTTDEEEDIESFGETCSIAVGICEAGTWRCVETEEGGKALECCASVTDEGVCIPPAGPEVEICNGLDDDCDGETDEELPNAGQACGLDMGICRPGTVECVCEGDSTEDCTLECVGQTFGTDEVCNALDDNCDGRTDEDIPLGAECTNAPGGTPVGECDSGFEQCVNGEWLCNANQPSDEICDGLDNDCDGVTDEDLAVECPDMSWCIEGECAPACLGEELSCLAGTRCVEIDDGEGSGIQVCLTDVCSKGAENALPCVENPYWCDEGYEPLCKCSQVQKKCISICEDIVCPDGYTCVASTGQCHVIEDDCYASGCPEGEICTGGECVDDPCPESCPDGQYCNGSGECVSPCDEMACTGLCFEGECVDRCDGVTCDGDEVCNDVTGECEPPDACVAIHCKFYEVCLAGECVEDPCLNIDCPNGFVCQYGSCSRYGEAIEIDTDDQPVDDSDAPSTDERDTDDTDNGEAAENFGMSRVLATGTGGCLCSSTPGASRPGASGLLFGFIGVLLLAARFAFGRLGGRAVLLGAMIVVIFLLGCNTEPFEMDFGGERGTSAGEVETEKSSEKETSFVADSDTTTEGCDPESADDDCDGVDDNCNGEIDEGVDLSSSDKHCGKCGNDCTVRYANAFGTCNEGTCRLEECAPHYQDLNDDAEDGCEYFCQKKSDRDGCNGVDLGDDSYMGVDDDCDGVTDEDVDLADDRFNCGRCGNVCSVPHAEAICDNGTCGFAGCDDNFHDVDETPDNGCEYLCESSGSEVCNGVDDDCDGEVDEGNPGGGAACYTLGTGCVDGGDDEVDCNGQCEAGTLQCRNGDVVCEGQKGPSLIEECNNIDDNCDGETDERLVRLCRSDDVDYEETGACLQGSQRCAAGEWGECVGEVLPSDEICDGVDNDCDGVTDEDPVDVGEACGGSPNSDDPNEGACQQGVTVCSETGSICQGEVPPAAEVCDSVDNDCDGFTDENITTVCGGCDPELYDYCASRSQGLCQPGVKYCSDGEYGDCVASIGPREEVCDGFDNDCDGTVDVDENGAPVTGEPCGTCGGIEHCIDSAMACCLFLDGDGKCVAPSAATGETCNGIDDDCDGVTDNNLVQVLCDGDDADACAEGVVTCEAGVAGCSDDTGDNPEVCDGLDNDCNGLTDDDLAEAPVEWCNTDCDAIGALQEPICAGLTGWVCAYNCADGADHAENEVECDGQGQVVAAETWCNGRDDDCDGETDEGLIGRVDHCGACGNDCWDMADADGNIASLACIEGSCAVNACDEGYWDLDGNEDGVLDCEYGPCTRIGAEGTTCDGVDDDCDGVTDNGAAITEVCNGVDDDCDGDTDEELSPPEICNSRCPNPGDHVVECLGSAGWKCNYNCIGETDGTVDCVDGDEYTIAADETLCDGLDNNCDGRTDEGFALWGATAMLGNRCTGTGVGACSKQGWVRCNDAQDGFQCCEEETGDTCTAIAELPEPIMEDESGSVPNGIDDDCDGVVDDGADGCITAATVPGATAAGDFDMFAFEASRRTKAATPCSESDGSPTPWTNVSFEEARLACLRLNTAESGCSETDPDSNADTCWDLCSSEQWYYSCAYWGDLSQTPHLYPYGDAYESATCNGLDTGSDALVGCGVQATCISDWGDVDVADLSGNAEEWTLGLRTDDGTDLRVIRGGSYKAVESGLTCDFDFFAAGETGFQLDQLGFRCCRGGEPLLTCEAALNTTNKSPYTFDIPGDPDRCFWDTWWANSTTDNNWQYGKTTEASVDTTSCVYATMLNGDYTNDENNRLFSSILDFSECGGESLSMSFDLWFDNDDDSGDVLTLQIRTSSDGESWSNWGDENLSSGNTIFSISSPNSGWTTYTETIVADVDPNLFYQLRFQFSTDGSGRALGAYLDNLVLEVN